jgi:hypothetical protein
MKILIISKYQGLNHKNSENTPNPPFVARNKEIKKLTIFIYLYTLENVLTCTKMYHCNQANPNKLWGPDYPSSLGFSK